MRPKTRSHSWRDLCLLLPDCVCFQLTSAISTFSLHDLTSHIQPAFPTVAPHSWLPDDLRAHHSPKHTISQNPRGSTLPVTSPLLHDFCAKPATLCSTRPHACVLSPGQSRGPRTLRSQRLSRSLLPTTIVPAAWLPASPSPFQPPACHAGCVLLTYNLLVSSSTFQCFPQPQDKTDFRPGPQGSHGAATAWFLHSAPS